MKTISSEKLYEVIRNPLISEKSTFVSQFNYYVFKVSPKSNKSEIIPDSSYLFRVSA